MKILIAGAGAVGSHLAKLLSSESNEITVIDSNNDRLDALRSNADIIAIDGNPSDIKVLLSAGADKADLFIAVYPSESQDVNIVSAILAKKLGSKKATARIDNEEYLSYEYKYMFTELGIDLMFYPEKIAANEIEGLLKRTASSDSLEFARGKLHMSVFKLEDDSPLIGMNMVDFSQMVEEDGLKFRVVAISRKNETIIPRFDTRFKYNDLVFIISKREGMETLLQYIGKHNFEINKLMILGGSPIGQILAKHLANQFDTVKLIEKDKWKCMEMSETLPDNVIIVNGDGRNSDMLQEESIRDFDAFVAVTDSTETNILACVAAKGFGVQRTIAEVENFEYIKLAERMGVDAIVNKKMITASRIFKFTLSDKVRFVKYMSGTNAEILEYIVAPDTAITRKPLKEMNFPKNAIIGGIIRGNDSYIAVGDTMIEAYDRVAVFALPDAVKEVDKFFK